MSKTTGLRLAVFVVVVAAVVGHRVFFVDTDEVRVFNDKLVDMIAESNSRFQPFAAHLEQYAKGQQVTVEAAARARDDFEKSVGNDRDLLKKMEVPDDDLCREFHGACLVYIENSLKLAEKCEEAVGYMSEHNPGSEADVEAMQALVADLFRKDETLLDTAIECQKKMVQEFDLEIE